MTRGRIPAIALTASVLLLVVAAPARTPGALAFDRTEERESCEHHDPLRQPFFGDLHVHTTLSFDAWAQGTRNTPRDAYRFARGEPLGVQPYGPDGAPLRTVRLERPLDFAMVSDHAELFGETRVCRTPGVAGYDSMSCVMLRRWPALAYMVLNSQWGSRGRHHPDICGDDGDVCVGSVAGPWQATQAAAEEFYDRTSSCELTTFVGYEWSGTRIGMNHRNVVFRNAAVPDYPANAIDDGGDETRLWATLESECIDADDDCDVLAIPHNSNLSLGGMFWSVGPDGAPLDAAMARRRSRLEPLAEITQHKGDSECRADDGDDLCGFETFDFGDIRGHASSLYRSPVPEGVYVREALVDGLEQHLSVGANPFKLGIIGSSDTHLGTPGLVDEDAFVGHAAGKITARLSVPALPDHPLFNPGGLAVIWAEENSRDALFEALRRREVYGTSGPRMVVRLFAGWDYPGDMCDSGRFAETGYEQGVPMGGDLPTLPDASSAAPVFAVRAMRDPGTGSRPGTALERIQIVKGWLEDGEKRHHVYDVAGSANADAGVDLATCEPTGAGADQLCSVWRDPDFDPALPAVYYARVVENPSCRWSWYACVAASVDCDDDTPRGMLSACCDPEIPRTIRERAWTSPVWYTPDGFAVHATGAPPG